jgi:hypothetical protein
VLPEAWDGRVDFKNKGGAILHEDVHALLFLYELVHVDIVDFLLYVFIGISEILKVIFLARDDPVQFGDVFLEYAVGVLQLADSEFEFVECLNVVGCQQHQQQHQTHYHRGC